MLDLPLMAQEEDITCGAVCFASMLQFFKRESPPEFELANALGTYDLGHTDPERIKDLAPTFNLASSLLVGAEKEDLIRAFQEQKVIFVTWWDEDAGHYSLIKSIDEKQVVLMDPWLAREGKFNQIPTDYFLSYWALRGSKMITVSE